MAAYLRDNAMEHRALVGHRLLVNLSGPSLACAQLPVRENSKRV